MSMRCQGVINSLQVAPWKILMEFYLSNFQANFSGNDGWAYRLWNQRMIVIGSY